MGDFGPADDLPYAYEGMVIDYVGISGATPDPAERSSACSGEVINRNSIQCNSGMMIPFTSRKIRDCTDGTSHTIVVAEQSGQVNGFKASANTLGGWCGYGNINTFDGWDASTPMSKLPPHRTWLAYPHGITTVRYPPNAYWSSGSGPPAGANTTASANTVLNSFHPGGVHILLTDGSVRFLSEYIQMETLQRLSVRDDGLAVGDY